MLPDKPLDMVCLIRLSYMLLLVCVLSSLASNAGKDAVEELWHSVPDISTAKKVHSDQTRLLFIAGLEGTGHHAWNAMFEVCTSSGKCEVDVNLTQHLMHYDPSRQTVHGLFGAADGSTHSAQLEAVHQHLHALAQRGGQHLHFVGLCFVKHSAMLSYPNYNGVHKPLDHPDISVLAALAESAGVDFRVLVLQRSAKEILASTEHRGIGGAMEPSILISNAAVLHTQLSLLDRRFYHCVQYRALGNLTYTQQEQLADFLHPTLIKPVLSSMLGTVHYSRGSESLSSNETAAARSAAGSHSNPRLENKLRRQQEKSAREAQGKSEEVREVEQRSARYQEWLLARRLALIDALCDTSP
jgi:hypothetical protein